MRFGTIFTLKSSVVAVCIALLLGFSTTSRAQGVTNLNAGDSINFSSLVGTNGLAVQIGDKHFADFDFQYSDTDGNIGNDLTPTALTLTALSNQIGFGISFTGPMAALGNVIKDIVVRFSIAVTNSSQLISDIHLDYNGTVHGSGFSTVTETIFTGGFGANQISQIDVFNLGSTNLLATAANLPSPQPKVYVEKDIVYGGGDFGNTNSAFISIIDQTFSQVPEPSTILLSVTGLVSLLFIKRRK